MRTVKPEVGDWDDYNDPPEAVRARWAGLIGPMKEALRADILCSVLDKPQDPGP